MTSLFFATDIHGSEICWKKFLNAGKFYRAGVLVLGGDMTAKALVPITQQDDGTYKATLLQQQFILKNEAEVRDMERRVGRRGYYPIRVTPEQLAEFAADPAKVDTFFHEQIMNVVAQWMALADECSSSTGLRRALDEAPKSPRWKLRAAIGERMAWYELPEEVDRG